MILLMHTSEVKKRHGKYNKAVAKTSLMLKLLVYVCDAVEIFAVHLSHLKLQNLLFWFNFVLRGGLSRQKCLSNFIPKKIPKLQCATGFA